MRTSTNPRGFGSPLRVFAIVMITAAIPSLAGCTRNYYYSGVPGCGPTQVVPGSTIGAPVQYGSVCEVPTQVTGGTNSSVVQLPNSGSTTILSGARPPRVVISEPLGAGSGRGVSSRFGWRPSDPEESLATTKVDGALNDSSTVR